MMKPNQTTIARPRIELFAAIASVGIISLSTVTAATIVAEDFVGDGSTLNGTTADTFASGITTAGGSSTWVTPTGYTNDGTIDGANTTGYLNLGTYINDSKGTASGKFTLSATLDVTSTPNWVGFGFFQDNTPSTAAQFTQAGSLGMGIIIYRSSNDLDGFAGPGSGNGATISTGTGVGPELLTLVLDLTPGGGYDDSTNFGTVTFYHGDVDTGINLGSYTHTTEQSFGSIGLTAATSEGTISNLQLSQVPEPSAAIMGILSMIFFLRRRR